MYYEVLKQVNVGERPTAIELTLEKFKILGDNLG